MVKLSGVEIRSSILNYTHFVYLHGFFPNPATKNILEGTGWAFIVARN